MRGAASAVATAFPVLAAVALAVVLVAVGESEITLTKGSL